MALFGKRAGQLSKPVWENITTVAQLEEEYARRRSALDRVSDEISRFAGSFGFIIAHVLLIGGWVALNSPMGERAFDPYPYVFLNLVLGIEAVLLGTFVLMSQNRQARQTDHWAHLGLQVSLLAERENTKGLRLLTRICKQLGLEDVADDKELREMLATTHVQSLAKELMEARETAKDMSQPAANGRR